MQVYAFKIAHFLMEKYVLNAIGVGIRNFTLYFVIKALLVTELLNLIVKLAIHQNIWN